MLNKSNNSLLQKATFEKIFLKKIHRLKVLAFQQLSQNAQTPVISITAFLKRKEKYTYIYLEFIRS